MMSSVAFLTFLTASLVGADASNIDSHVKMMRGEQEPTPTSAPPSGHAYQGENVTAGKVVNVHLFYETKCPDCIEFINGTLAPMWRNKEMKGFLNITMNPYGNAMSLPVANVSTGYKWWHPVTSQGEWSYVHLCQHGVDECLGNLIQTCAISLTNQENYMEFVFCMAEKPNWSIEKSSYECMTQHNIDHDQVKDCVESPQGNKLFADYGKITGAVQGRQGTPWVLINGKSLDNPAELEKTVCTHVMVQDPSGPETCLPYLKAAASKDSGAPAPSDDFTVLTKKANRSLVALDKRHI